MKVTLIRPHMTARRAADALEPLAFAILAGLTPQDVELALYDDRIEPIPYDEPTDLVALTAETFTAKRAYQISSQYRRRGVPVLMGGYHPTLAPDEALLYADAIVIGDAENVWSQVIHDARAGRLRRVYRSESPPSLCRLRPDRTIFMRKPYAPVRLVQFGRGCRYACDFCSIHAFYGASLRQRPIEDVVAEISGLDGKFVIFADDNLFVHEQQAEALFRALGPLGTRWACQISVDIARNVHLLDLMAKSGCFAVLLGLESLNEENLAQMKKKWNLKQGAYSDILQEFYRHGIMVAGTFVFGYDHDTPVTLERTLEFAMHSKLALAHFNTLIPTPGTPLYRRLQAEGRLIYGRWWLDDRYRYGEATFHPRRISAAELGEGCFRLRQQFNAYGAILSRACDRRMNAASPRNLLAFLAINVVSRKEIHNKQWQPLGGGTPGLPGLQVA